MYPCEHCGLPRDGKSRFDNSGTIGHECIPELKACIKQLKTERNMWEGKWSETETARVNIRAELERLQQWERPEGFPEVVCLCGSTRFMDTFHAVGWQLTLDGYIVLTVGVCKHAKDHGGEALGSRVADKLDELHHRKIDLANWIMVLNVGGYIGDSTREEIAYAKTHNKMVVYLEDKAAKAEPPEGE